MTERQPSNDPVPWHSAMEQDRASDRSQIPATNSLAHVRRNDDGSFAIHELEEHLRAVGDLVQEFALNFGQGEWGYLVGLWHDFGEYFAVFKILSVCGNGIAIWMQRIEV